VTVSDPAICSRKIVSPALLRLSPARREPLGALPCDRGASREELHLSGPERSRQREPHRAVGVGNPVFLHRDRRRPRVLHFQPLVRFRVVDPVAIPVARWAREDFVQPEPRAVCATFASSPPAASRISSVSITTAAGDRPHERPHDTFHQRTWLFSLRLSAVSSGI